MPYCLVCRSMTRHMHGREQVGGVMQVLRVVEALPLSPDDLHTVTSAQGCFADTLRELVTHTRLEPSAEVRQPPPRRLTL